MTRRTFDGANPGGWVPEQRVTFQNAMQAYTIAGAYAAFREDQLGSIELGKLADFVVFSVDLSTTPPEEIVHAVVDMTVVEGEIVYRREGAQ